MKKNVAGQKVGAQMITAADGSVFTGSVTVYVTGDAGTQAAGSVGAGACTHEGNGYHTYAPAQAETNYDLVAFTFVGTGAVAATVQVYPSFPQTGDSFGLIGATGSGLTSVASATDLATVAGYLDTEIAAIKAKTDNLPAAPASTTNITAGTITTVTNLTNLPTIPADWLTAAGTAADFSVEIADAVFKRDWTAITGEADRSLLNAGRFLRNKWSVAAGTLTVKKEDDSTTAWTATISTDAAADPITGSDPA